MRPPNTSLLTVNGKIFELERKFSNNIMSYDYSKNYLTRFHTFLVVIHNQNFAYLKIYTKLLQLSKWARTRAPSHTLCNVTKSPQKNQCPSFTKIKRRDWHPEKKLLWSQFIYQQVLILFWSKLMLIKVMDQV